MKYFGWYRYALNCFVLTMPIILWNIVFIEKLPEPFQPEVFWSNIPTVVAYSESISRLLILILLAFIPITLSNKLQKVGFALYLIGVCLYFAAWINLIYFPKSVFSNTIAGFMAPAYTPIIWLLGIGLIGKSYYFNMPFSRWPYLILMSIFLLFHNYHTFIIYYHTH